MDNKPYKDYICPRCKHNVGFRQQFCSLCGLELSWSDFISNSITYSEQYLKLPNVISNTSTPYDVRLTGTDFKNIEQPAVITC